MFDIITIGTTTLDTFLKVHDASIKCSLNKTNSLFCVNYADKIPVDEWHQSLGGNGANNAVGSARLGLKTAIYTVYGDDQTGHLIEKTFQKEAVSLDYVNKDSSQKTDNAVVINFQSERTIFTYHEKRNYKLPDFAPAKWVYYTSLMKGFESIHKDLLKYLKKYKVRLAFNPGTHQLLAGKEVFKEILQYTDVLILNKEEAQRFLEDSEKDIKVLLKELHKLGPQTIVITNGRDGSYSHSDERFLKSEILPAENIEATGAGDSYSSGFLASLIHEGDVSQAMTWGSFNASSVVQKIGAQAGLLYKDELEKLLKENPGFRPKAF